MASALYRLLRMRRDLSGAGDEHCDCKCKKGSLCQGPAGEELYNLVHWLFATYKKLGVRTV